MHGSTDAWKWTAGRARDFGSLEARKRWRARVRSRSRDCRSERAWITLKELECTRWREFEIGREWQGGGNVAAARGQCDGDAKLRDRVDVGG